MIIDRVFVAALNEDSTYDEVAPHYNELRGLLVMGDAQATRTVVCLIGLSSADGAYAEMLSDLAPLAYENDAEFWAAAASLPRPAQQTVLAKYDWLHAQGVTLLDWNWPREEIIEANPGLAGLTRR